MTDTLATQGDQINLDQVWQSSDIQALLDKLNEELIGLVPVKTRIREIAAMLLVARLR